MYHKYPKFAKAIAERHIMYNRELNDMEQLQQQGKIVVIRPSKLVKIKHMEKNLNILNEVYQLGRQDAIKVLPQVKKFLGNV